jgi:hypothetical protein
VAHPRRTRRRTRRSTSRPKKSGRTNADTAAESIRQQETGRGGAARSIVTAAAGWHAPAARRVGSGAQLGALQPTDQ